MSWWGWLALGVSIGVVLGVFVMALLVAAGREPTETAVDNVAGEAEEWLRDRRSR